MTNNDILIISPLDQDIEIQDKDHIQDKIKQMILDSITEKDAKKAIHICSQIVNILNLGGLALADSLYLIYSHWSEFEIHDDFFDTMSSSIGLHKHTVQTYVTVSKMYAQDKIPETYREDIKSKSIRSQVPIAQALDAGYEIENDEWEELVDAPDFSTINAKLRDIKGKEPRSNALILMIDRDGGIKAMKSGKQVYIGWLNISDENEIVQQAIERLIKGGGILSQ